jgi:hypothetical protein
MPAASVPSHEADQRLKLLTAGSEPNLHSRLADRAAGVAGQSDRTITITAPERQDFAHRRIKFTSTGVEIGGHVRPPFVVDEGHEQRRLRHPLYDSSGPSHAQRRRPPTPPNTLKTPANASPGPANRPTTPTSDPARRPQPQNDRPKPPASTGDSLPVQTVPDVPSEEPHPVHRRRLQPTGS